MDVIIVNKRSKKSLVGYKVVDVTRPSVFSPFYPHEFYFHGYSTKTVEGLWQGLKYIEGKGIDPNKLGNTTMKNIKRSGKVLYHEFNSQRLGYIQARKEIYIPLYNMQLDRCEEYINELRKHTKIALLDYDTNEDVENTHKPLSHASLIKKRLLISRPL